MEPLPKKTLGQRMRELRQSADLSLREVGEKLKDKVTNTHVSAAFLSDIENGRRFPSDDMLEKMAELFSVDVAELRRCDPRGPAKEIQDLATMNPGYAFAFRRAVEFIQASNISPEAFAMKFDPGDIILSSNGLIGTLNQHSDTNIENPPNTENNEQ